MDLKEFKEYCKTVTKEEFLRDNNGFVEDEIGCPQDVGLTRDCNKSCIRCWENAVKDIKFKEEKLTFKEVITNIKEGQSWKSGLFTIICEDENNIKLTHKDLNECFIIDIKEDLFKLEEQEVPVLQAMESFDNGKTIECVYKSANDERIMRETFVPQEQNTIKKEDIITPYMIIKGKWYIKG